jgi:DeoR/GlpR family transcriptional regulator of sugar metabolism
MLESDRNKLLLSQLVTKPFLSVQDLQDSLGVSAATVRRDIEKLAQKGIARKVHGGVALSDNLMSQQQARNLPFLENRDIAVAEKTAIAREAVKLVRDGSIIIVHAGSTCFHFGCAIANMNLRVITNSHPLASYLGDYGTCQITVGGGDLHREPGIYFDVNQVTPGIYASQFFVGALGVGPGGVLEANPLLVKVVGETAQFASDVIVLVDSRKFDARPPTLTLPFSKISMLITDDKLSDRAAKVLEDSGVDYRIAAVNG